DHAEGRPGPANEFRQLPGAAHERGAGGRGPYRAEFGAAGRHGRGRDLAHRSRRRQCDLCGDRQAAAEAAGGHQSVEATGLMTGEMPALDLRKEAPARQVTASWCRPTPGTYQEIGAVVSQLRNRVTGPTT